MKPKRQSPKPRAVALAMPLAVPAAPWPLLAAAAGLAGLVAALLR